MMVGKVGWFGESGKSPGSRQNPWRKAKGFASFAVVQLNVVELKPRHQPTTLCADVSNFDAQP
mgnify:CR=1 FL=1